MGTRTLWTAAVLLSACGGSGGEAAAGGGSSVTTRNTMPGGPSGTAAEMTAGTSSGVAGESTSGPSGTDLGAVEVCAAVTLPGPAEGGWSVQGPPGFDVPRLANGTWVYRAPAVVVDTPVTFVHSQGGVVTMTVAAAAASPGLADGMVAGCGPFPFGVASGDPGAADVWLWTRVDPAQAGTVRWEVAADASFGELVASGTAEPDAADDHTVNVHATGLDAATTYYYRFVRGETSVETTSVTGRTRTAPAGAADQLQFAVVSCTSIFSGYFNGYRAIARRLDLDGLIHVGDYTYDFPDEDERVRIPEPVPEDPESLEGWRALHAYHLSDPDLRAARAAHPWIMLWDNHDVNAGAPVRGGGVQAFREWNPVSDTERDTAPQVIYRTLSFGDLLDVVITDVLLFRDDADAPDNADKLIFGQAQREWFHQTLRDSQAVWKVVGNQKPVAPILGLLQALGGSTWNGFPDARSQMFETLAADQIDNALFLSGDAHITVVADLVGAPDDAEAYDSKTGEGAVAVEFQPASMSRGNVDEFFPAQPQLPMNLEADAARSNPHYRFLDTTRHGYGVLTIDAERILAEIWYLDILARTDEETLGASLEVRAGANHWQR